MCWAHRASTKMSVASGGCFGSFCPSPNPLPNGACAVGEGEKNKGVLQAGYARLQNPTKKSPPSPRVRGGKGQGIEGKS